MPMLPYNRGAAVEYAHRWAYSRNPRYFNFTGLGGDCTNFASQCIFAGSGVMNYTPVTGWFYISANNRTPSWTGVQFLYHFLIGNKGPGPFAETVPITGVLPGDIVQLGNSTGRFYHSPVIVAAGSPAMPHNILVAAHTNDADYRPLSTYQYSQARFLHILGVRR